MKKLTISRKDAKAQRFICRNFFVFFAPIAALRLCVNYFCSSWNYFTPSEPLHFRAAMQRDAFANFTKRDARAIAMYLKTIPTVSHAVPGPFGPNEKAPVFVMKVVPPAP